MRQVLLNSQQAFVARLPRPALVPGCVLVQLHYSMISIGTEIAGLKHDSGSASRLSPLAQIKNLSQTAIRYLSKAIKNPQVAKQRIKLILKQRMPVNPNKPHDETLDLGWNVGYSAVGEVIAVGPGVADLSIGSLVACAGAGKANHADFVSVPRNLVCVLPHDCDEISAASTTIGTIALQGVRRAKVSLGDKVAVLGLGLIGQLTSQMLKTSGCTVYGHDLDVSRLDIAKDLGMQDGSDSDVSFKQLVQNVTQEHGVDVTIITAATKSNAVINLAMEITRRKGRVVIVGDVGLNVERSYFYRKEIDLLMSSSYGPGRYDETYEEQGHDYPFAYVRWTMNRNMQAYLDLLKNGQVQLKPLINKVVSVDNATQVYQELATSKKSPLAVVFSYPEYTQELPGAANSSVINIIGHRPTPDVPVNYVLVGAGAFGISMLVPQLNKFSKTFSLKGVVSRDPIRGGNYAKQNALEIFASSLDEVIKRDDVQMLVIATRHAEHSKQVIAGLQAGKHVFVEKPLATTWTQLDEIQTFLDAQTSMPMLMVGFNRRFSPAMQTLKQHVSSRKSPLMIQYRLNGGYIAAKHWIQTEQGAGRNIGEACHMYDCFRYLIGAPVCEINATAINPADGIYQRNDNFVATLRYEDGSVATLTYTALGPKNGLSKEQVEVFCDGDAYIIDDYKSLVKASSSETLWSGSVDKGHAYEIQALDQALNASGKGCPIALDEIMETTAVSLRVEDLINGICCE